MPYLNPNWALDFLPVQFKFDDIASLDLQPVRHLGTNEHSIVPSKLGHRLGKFLQPADVGELSVVDAGVAADVELDRAGIVSPRSRIYARPRRDESRRE